jgi:hypothetical protein
MQALLLICHGAAFEPPATIGDATAAWIDEVERRGMRRSGGRLRPTGESTVVRGGDHGPTEAPGPRLDVDEQVAGYDVLEADSLDDILEVVRRHPMAQIATIEVRPVWDEPGTH